jgi:GT2 family glycosyltransferase
MNRPDELSRCLDSVFQNVDKPDEVIVSDDSPNEEPGRTVVARYPDVIYQSGPRRGLGPNRNACIQRASGSHIIFVDDDVCIPAGFFATARQLIASCEPKTIITGYQLDHGDYKIVPHNADFWGLQRVPVRNEYRAIVINSTIFPKSLFERALFDEHVRYGSEELDISQHAVSLGYRITYQDCLYVNHYPSPVNRDKYKQFIEASRLYVTTKAYWQYERSVPKTLVYILLAPLQLAGSAIRRGDARAIWGAFQSTALAWRYLCTSPKVVQPRDTVVQKT